ncbi:MAG: NAD-dependent epimerase/dehydratase family protein [Desulfurococcaceae archaeon]
MRIAVTGGAGFIGGHIAIYLAEKGFDVVVIDNLERCNEYIVSLLENHGIPIVKADVRSFECCGGFNIVIHTAAYINVAESMERPVEYLDNNVIGVARIAHGCIKAGCKLIYTSSASVYGNPVKLPISEEHPINPLSPYGLSKYLGELVIKHFEKIYNLKHIILRLFNVYGPGQSGAYAGVVGAFIERALRNKPLVIYGDGNNTRDFVYVKDVAEVIYRFINKDMITGDVYNVGTGVSTSIKELALLVKRLVNRDVDIIYEAERPGDIKNSYADNRKLISAINMVFTPLETGLRYTIDSMKGYMLIDRGN